MYVDCNIPDIYFPSNTSIVLRPTLATTLKSYYLSLHQQDFLLNSRYIYSFVIVFIWEATSNVLREHLFGTSIYIFVLSTPMNSVKVEISVSGTCRGWVNGCLCSIIRYVISTTHTGVRKLLQIKTTVSYDQVFSLNFASPISSRCLPLQTSIYEDVDKGISPSGIPLPCCHERIPPRWTSNTK